MITLSIREKNIVSAGGILGIIFIAIQFIYFPAVDNRKELNRILMVERDSLRQIQALQKKYLAQEQNLDLKKEALGFRDKTFTLFSFLDLQAEKSGIKKNIDYMKPFSQDLENYRISKVKLKIKNVFLNELMAFIKRIETSDSAVQIISLSLSKAGKKKDRLDAVIETQTLMIKESF